MHIIEHVNYAYLSKDFPILVRNLWIWPLTCPSKSLMGGRKRGGESNNRLNMQKKKKTENFRQNKDLRIRFHFIL